MVRYFCAEQAWKRRRENVGHGRRDTQLKGAKGEEGGRKERGSNYDE
jgi:hypothetical protein